jgi:hypothetical protein
LSVPALLCGIWLAVGVPASAGADAEGASASDHDEHALHRHHVSAVLGASQKGSKEAWAYGLQYGYRLNRRLSLGAFWERTNGDFDAETLGIPLSIYATQNLKVVLGVGVEKQLFEEDETVLRLGLNYDFHLGNFTITPASAVDFVNNNEIWFLGLELGLGF